MNTLGTLERPPFRISAAAAFLVGMGGLAFTLTLLWLSMRVVLGVGGFCASGGPYVPAVVCPDEVLVLMPLSIFSLFIFGGLAGWGGTRLGGGWLRLISLGWPALFLSLGWNFLEFGLWPPGGAPGEIVWAWVICAVVFAAMGAVPLVILLRGGTLSTSYGRRAWSGKPMIIDTRGSADPWLAVQQALSEAGISTAAVQTLDLDRGGAPGGSPGAEPDGAEPDIATRLEKLAGLHRAGDLTDAEFESAKRTTLDGAGS